MKIIGFSSGVVEQESNVDRRVSVVKSLERPVELLYRLQNQVNKTLNQS